MPRTIKRAPLVTDIQPALTVAGVVGALAASLSLVDRPNEPRLLSRSLPRPVLLEVILAGLYPAPRYPDGDANGYVERGVNEEAPAMR